ncbi:MAG: hypothetical protein Q7S09_01650 [bacterium]|nr:hypothetical protein [bacterium]
MLIFSIVVAVLVVGGYVIRRRLRRAWYILWTGELDPDWEKLYRKWYGDAGPELLEMAGRKGSAYKSHRSY